MLSYLSPNVLRVTKLIFACVALLLLFNFPIRAAAGDLDSSFGQDGISLPVDESFAGAWSVTLHPDGKIVAGGKTNNGQFAVVRYLAHGQIDSSFGNNGRVTTSFAENNGFNCYLNDVAILSDGKIVAAGEFWSPNPFGVPGYRINLVVVRYNSDGSIDTTFNANGKFIYTEGGLGVSAQAIAVQPDGKFLVTGYAGGTFDGNVPYKSLLFRFSAGGLDSNFGDAGLVITQVPGETKSYSIALQANGRIIVGGQTYSTVAGGLSLARYNPDGSPDSTFGDNGRIVRSGENLGEAVQVLIQPDGKIVAVCPANALGNSGDFALLRVKSDGSPDTGFGTNGKVITNVSNIVDKPEAAALQADGKIVVAGFSVDYSINPSDYTTELARYNPNGSLDLTFGVGGIVRTPASFPLSDVLIQNENKILATGNGYGNSPTGFRVLRYQAHGTREFDFDGDGRADISIFRPAASAEWYWLGSSNNQSSGLQFGIGTDKIVPADFDGDGKTDIAVFRDGDWYRLNSSNNQFVAVHFGQSGDAPVPADYDGDSKADLAVYRAGNWYILNSSNDSFRADQFGIATDKPIVGDFDGDGKSDLTVYRDGTWYGQRSRDGFFGVQFGVNTDKPVAADYDGDGKTDVAVYRPSDGTWYLQRSHLGFTATQFGIATDKPVPADYNNDGKTDIAVFRDGTWHLAGFRSVQFGQAGDVPVPSALLP